MLGRRRIPLFRTAATAYGKFAMAVALTGMGRDGCLGAAYIAASGGPVAVQDPATAVAPMMPRTVWESGAARTAAPIPELAVEVGAWTRTATKELRSPG